MPRRSSVHTFRESPLFTAPGTEAALLAATASGVFPDLQTAAAAMVRPGEIVHANPARRAFHDAKYAVYMSLYNDWRRYRQMMR